MSSWKISTSIQRTDIRFCSTPPSINCPADFNSCPGSSIHPNVSGTAVALKGSLECDEPLVTYKDIIVKTGNCVGASLIQRVWTATDPNDASLRAFCIQYINTLDTTALNFITALKILFYLVMINVQRVINGKCLWFQTIAVTIVLPVLM